jgi:hypothetical protein
MTVMTTMTDLFEFCNKSSIISQFQTLFILPKWYFGAILGTGFFIYYLLEVAKVG